MLGITREVLLFSKESEMSHILSKTVLYIKMSHIGKFISILVFVTFSYEATKTNVLGKKVATSEISTELTEMIFFHQTHETRLILPKTVLHLKTNHIPLF